MKGEVEELRHDLSALNDLGVAGIVSRYDALIRALEEPSMLISHSFGSLVVQILLDRGYGAAGVPIDGVGPKGALRLTLSARRSPFCKAH